MDEGSNVTTMTETLAKRLSLPVKDSKERLNIRTLSGKTTASIRNTTLKIGNADIDCFVVDANLILDTPSFNLKQIWPNLDNNLERDINNNIACGDIDVIVGMDQLYTKVYKHNEIKHATLGLRIVDTIFGHTIGGNTTTRSHGVEEPIEIQAYATTIDNVEPTIIEEKGSSSTESEIQADIARMFNTEQHSSVDTEETKSPANAQYTADEQYAEEQFKANVQLKNGKYYVRPIFKQDFFQ